MTFRKDPNLTPEQQDLLNDKLGEFEGTIEAAISEFEDSIEAAITLCIEQTAAILTPEQCKTVSAHFHVDLVAYSIINSLRELIAAANTEPSRELVESVIDDALEMVFEISPRSAAEDILDDDDADGSVH